MRILYPTGTVATAIALVMGASSAYSQQTTKPASPNTVMQKKQTSAFTVTDTEGVATRLVAYGIVYRPFASNTLGNASREGIIIERGEGGENLPWGIIAKLELVDPKHATITLHTGKVINRAELRGGTLVGTTELGTTFFLHLSKIKTIVPGHPPKSTRRFRSLEEFAEELLKNSDQESSSITKREAVEALARQIAKEYMEGGAQIYILPTGKLVRAMPKSVRNATDYAAFWMWRNDPVKMECVRRGIKDLTRYPGFEKLCATRLYSAVTEDQKAILGESIARTFCLGGEIQGDLPTVVAEGWVRRLPPGVSTVEEFVDFLLKRANTPGYCGAVNKLEDEHIKELETIYQAYDKMTREKP